MLVTTNVIQDSVGLDASFNGSSVNVKSSKIVSIFATVSNASTLNGDFKLQCSPDNSTWVDIASSSQNVTADGSIAWHLSNVGYSFIRAVYTRTGGDGDVVVQVTQKIEG